MEIRVNMIIEVPIEATNEQILEWVRFVVGNNGSMKSENPLCDYDLEAKYVEIK